MNLALNSYFPVCIVRDVLNRAFSMYLMHNKGPEVNRTFSLSQTCSVLEPFSSRHLVKIVMEMLL